MARTPQYEANPGVMEAITIAGPQQKLADMLGVKQPTISIYLYRRCPAERAAQIEKLVGVSKNKIRPDIFF